jgi:hypothetical protein
MPESPTGTKGRVNTSKKKKAQLTIRHEVHVIAAVFAAGSDARRPHVVAPPHAGNGADSAKRVVRRHRVDVVTHGRNGRIRLKNSFGNESAAPDSD